MQPRVNRLIVFTRYPEAGTTKTRLIPALGAEGAAALQRQMTDHTLDQVRQFRENQPLTVEIRFAGGDRTQMQRWLGDGYLYQPQGNGDLGARMGRALEAGWAAGSDRILMIGSDCPGLEPSTLSQALDRLDRHDVVLGPALDGGYYLIGTRRAIPELFQDIDWSTERVLAQTLARAESLNLTVALLEPLGDVDRPEDLSLWEAVQSNRSTQDSISVIIPVLNGGDRLRSVLHSALRPGETETIVVDGGSCDGTADLARAMGATVIHSLPGRARQMNWGAAIATGRILVFLHGDTRLPPTFPAEIRRALAQPNTIAGAFDLGIDSLDPRLRWVERGVQWRSRWLQLPYGDQALFLRADTFNALGGFVDMPIMEDFEFVQRLRRLGRIAIVPTPVQTSPRRWETVGIWQTTLINQLVVAGYFLGIPTERLAQWYRRKS